MTIDGFGGTPPLVIEPLYGIRRWLVYGDYLAPLTSVAPQHGWRGGENVAVHMGNDDFCIGLVHPNCRCGFYAHYRADEERDEYQWSVEGVIRGYGLATLGTKGFRCERAEIVAVSREEGPLRRPLPDPFASSYPGVAVFDTAAEMLTAFPLSRAPEGVAA